MKKQNTAAFSFSPCHAAAGGAFDTLAGAAALLLGVMALGAGLTGAWSSRGWLCALAGAAAVCWQCAARRVWNGRARAALPLLILLAAAALSRQVLAGAVSAARAACAYWTEATGHLVLPPAGEAGDLLLFACLTAALTGALCAETARLSRTACGLLLTAELAALLLALRPERTSAWMAVCLFAAAFLLAGGSRGSSAARLPAQALLLAAAGLLTAALLAIPALRGGAAFSAWRTQSVTALHRLRYERGERVLPEGDFAGFSVDADGQTPCLTVTMEQPTALYLRGFTAETFTDDTWQASDRQTLAAQSDLLYWLHRDGFYPQTQLAAAARCLPQGFETQTVQIENTGACSAWDYVPYGLAAIPAGSALTETSLEDAAVPARGPRGTRAYQFVMLADPEQTAAQTLELLSEQPEAASRYLSQEGSYRSAVQARERSMDDETRAQLAPLLDAVCEEYGAAETLTPEQAQLCTLRFLEQLQTLREGGAALPLDDLARDTTYQTATLTVLALRYYGIPARYAEGFVLTQETAARTAAGQAVTLTDADAQAWAEVYQDGIGWMPLALMPGYGELTDPSAAHRTPAGGQTGDGQSETDTLPQADTAGEETDEQTQDAPQEQQTPGSGQAPQQTSRLRLWLPMLVAALLLAALAVRYMLCRRRREQRLNAEPPAQAVTWTVSALAPLWTAAGEDYHGGSLFALSDALAAQDAAYAAAVRRLAELNGEARFSSRAMTSEQAEQAREVWRLSVARLSKTCRPLRRFWLKWIRCLY